jgi:hypothetical protein
VMIQRKIAPTFATSSKNNKKLKVLKSYYSEKHLFPNKSNYLKSTWFCLQSFCQLFENVFALEIKTRTRSGSLLFLTKFDPTSGQTNGSGFFDSTLEQNIRVLLPHVDPITSNLNFDNLVIITNHNLIEFVVYLLVHTL